jgi:hypothetical protein
MSEETPAGDGSLARADGQARLDPAHFDRLERAATGARLLCDALWETVGDELAACRDGYSGPTGPGVRRSAVLADRLAEVAGAFTLVARTGTGSAAEAVAERLDEPAQPAGGAAPRATHGAALIDEREEHAGTAPAIPRPSNVNPSRAGADVPVAPAPAGRDGELRPPWGDLLARALRRFQRDGLPFALLQLELLAPTRLPEGLRLGQLIRRVEGAVEALAPGAASLVRESPVCLWVHLADTDRVGAHEFAERLTASVEKLSFAGVRPDPAGRYFAALSAHGSRPSSSPRATLGFGVAACPEDGCDAAGLAACAQAGLAAMREQSREALLGQV